MKFLMQFLFVIFLVHVLAVKDGDTIQVSDSTDSAIYNIRFYGMDAPEKKQPFGQDSKTFLSALILNKDVMIQLISGDIHGRLVCKVLMTDGTYVNELMVEKGYAWYYEFYAPRDAVLKQAQDTAIKNKAGLWKDNNPVAPWDYRKQAKEKVNYEKESR